MLRNSICLATYLQLVNGVSHTLRKMKTTLPKSAMKSIFQTAFGTIPNLTIMTCVALDTPEEIEFINVTATSAMTQWTRSKAKVEGYDIEFLETGVQGAETVSKKV